MLFERIQEHAWADMESLMHNDLSGCKEFLHMFGMLSMDDHLFEMKFMTISLPQVKFPSNPLDRTFETL